MAGATSQHPRTELSSGLSNETRPPAKAGLLYSESVLAFSIKRSHFSSVADTSVLSVNTGPPFIKSIFELLILVKIVMNIKSF